MSSHWLLSSMTRAITHFQAHACPRIQTRNFSTLVLYQMGGVSLEIFQKRQFCHS